MRIVRQTEQQFIELIVHVVRTGTGSVEDHKSQKMGDGLTRLIAERRLKQELVELGGEFGFAHIASGVAEQGQKIARRKNFLYGERSNGRKNQDGIDKCF